MQLLRKIGRLPLEDRALVARAWGALVLARVALWVLPWQFARRAAAAAVPRAEGATADAVPDRIRWAIVAASRFVPGATCLTQALALQGLLARRGSVATMHLGVRQQRGAPLDAHAWLELDGQVLLGANGPEAVRYLSLDARTRRGAEAPRYEKGR